MNPCKYCNETHTSWWDQCEASVVAEQAHWNRPKEPDPIPTTYQPACWINPYGIKRIKANNGVLRMCAFDERLSNSANDSQTVPLYPPLPETMMVVRVDDVKELLKLLVGSDANVPLLRDISSRVSIMLDNAEGLVTL
jgi:hypothetical protein